MKIAELIAFILYFVLVLGIGLFFFFKDKKQDNSEKGFFLGGRHMQGLVAALSAGASDMSAWVLMGLPASIYLYGMGQVWISIGLAIGTTLSWFLVAPRLRRYAIKANDSITIPQYLKNRFDAKDPTLQIICAVIFMLVYCVYGASSINACGTLFNTLFGLDEKIAMTIAVVIIIAYVFLGGFNAVCWTDFFQGMLMLVALLVTPIVVLFAMDPVAVTGTLPANYYNMLVSGKFDWASISSILTGLSWGLGYFGMPHIIIRYMSISSEKEMKKSKIIGPTWTAVILIMTTVVAIVARKYFGDSMEATSSTLFVQMTRSVLPAFLAGIIITAILAASMSTADSQLLAASSAFATDFYKTTIRKNANDKEIVWVGRIVVVVVSLIAYVIAMLGTGTEPIVPAFSTIMSLVSAAWAAFGAAFGPAILLSLFWRRFNYKGAIAGITVGFVIDLLWMFLFNYEYYNGTSAVFNTGLYEIIPGFIMGLIAAIVVSVCTKAPSQEVLTTFDEVNAMKGIDKEEA